MSKDDVLAEFAIDLADPGAQRDGNILGERLLSRSRELMGVDRPSLVSALAQWLEEGDPVLSVQAAILARELHLFELREVIMRVRDGIGPDSTLRPTSAWIFDRAADALK
jgi:hypothetical protein